MSLTLMQQINQEIEQEAKLEKRISRIVNRFLKQPDNSKFYRVETKDKADALLVFNRDDLSKYFIISNNDGDTLAAFERTPTIILIYLKNKNPHDRRNTTIGDIRANHIPIASIKARVKLATSGFIPTSGLTSTSE